jgi:hypothetical protein
MEAQYLSDAEFIRQELDKGGDVLVQKNGEYQIMIAYGYALVDNGIALVTSRDVIKCKWQEDSGQELKNVFNIFELTRAV